MGRVLIIEIYRVVVFSIPKSDRSGRLYLCRVEKHMVNFSRAGSFTMLVHARVTRVHKSVLFLEIRNIVTLYYVDQPPHSSYLV